jgi:hypothetical protein
MFHLKYTHFLGGEERVRMLMYPNIILQTEWRLILQPFWNHKLLHDVLKQQLNT